MAAPSRGLGDGSFLTAAMALGLFFRLASIEVMPVGYDEALSLVRASGYTVSEVQDGLARTSDLRVADVQRYQRPPAEGDDLARVLGAIAFEESRHPPVYFLALAIWLRWAGDSLLMARALSALFSMLLIPAAYALAKELLGSRSAARLAAALVAVAPIHVLYGREVRQYALWVVLVVMASVVLLKALRRSTLTSWLAYAALVAGGFLTHVLFLLTSAAHAAHVFWPREPRTSPAARGAFAAASAVIALLSVPRVDDWRSDAVWTSGGWTGEPVAPVFWIGAVVRNLASPFLDLLAVSPPPTGEGVYGFFASAPMLLLAGLTAVVAGMAVMCVLAVRHHAPPGAWRFLLLPLGMTALAFVVPDLALGGRRTTIFRYFLPALVAIELAVAAVLAAPGRARFLARVAVLAGAVVSCVTIIRAETWWSKAQNRFDSEDAAILRRARDPLLVVGPSRPATVNLLCLSHRLDPALPVTIVSAEAPALDPLARDVFVFLDPTDSPSTREAIERRYEIESSGPRSRLWRVTGQRENSRTGSSGSTATPTPKDRTTRIALSRSSARKP